MSTRADLWKPFLDRREVVILDGGLATELERRGAVLDNSLWSAKLLLQRPELIREVHLDYFRAGADIGTSASYQATIPGLLAHGLTESQAADLLRLSVRLVQEAREAHHESQWQSGRPPPLVAASAGSYGAYLADGSEFRGDYELSLQELRDWHRPRLEVLADSGADVIAFETVPLLREGEAIVRLLEEFPRTVAWLSFSCRDARRLCHGELFSEALQMVNEAPNIAAAGVNCTAPRHIDGLLASVHHIARKPLIVYPNSGECWNPATRSWEPSAELFDWAAAAARWRLAGATIIGGCCRTTPETVAAIAADGRLSLRERTGVSAQ